MNQPLLFICGPYRGDTRNNIEKAKSLSMHLWAAGYPNICPHLNSGGFEATIKDDGVFLDGYRQILLRCDAVITIPGWLDSEGSRAEVKTAEQNGIEVLHQVYYGPGAISGLLGVIARWWQAVRP